MKVYRLTLPIILALTALVLVGGILALAPTPARADAPPETRVYTYTFPTADEVADFTANGSECWDSTNYGIQLGGYTPVGCIDSYNGFNGNGTARQPHQEIGLPKWEIMDRLGLNSNQLITSITVSGRFTESGTDAGTQISIISDTTTLATTGYQTGMEWERVMTVTAAITDFETIWFYHYQNNVPPWDTSYGWLDDIIISVTFEPSPIVEECATVPNSGFNFANEDWLFWGDVTLNPTNTVTIGPSGEAFQSISSLRPNSSYSAVVSVATTLAEPVDLLVRLGSEDQLVEVQDSGLYTATFLTPASITNTTYLLKNVNESGSVELDFTCLYGAMGFECPLIPDADFNSGSEWDLFQATVASSTLTLKPTGYAHQSLPLDANTAYGGVISVTGVTSGATSLFITTGETEDTLPVDAPGEYTFVFTTPVNLVGPLTFGLANHEAATFEIDAICIYASGTAPDGRGDCLAPLNGTFDTAEGWTYLRGAEWYSPAKEATLPYANTGLIFSTSTYSLPTLASGEHLLLSFTSRKAQAENDGGIMGRVKSGGSSTSFTYEVYPTDYVFETGLDSMAGLSDAEMAFVNPGLEGSPIFSGTADISLDDICIFTANREPRLPYPEDPNAIIPIDLGFNYTSCEDIDGILAWFGVNIQQYRAEYEAGASLWDPIGWVPWLIAAMWVILDTYLCIFMAAFVTLVDLLEYILNNFLNIGSWVIRQAPLFITWLAQWLSWGNLSSINLTTGLGTFFVAWAEWFANWVLVISAIVNLTIAAALVWLALSISLQVGGIGAFLIGLLAWLSRATANDITTLLNALIGAWNLLLPFLGIVFSGVLDDLAWLWNDNLRPFFNAVWAFLGLAPLGLLDFVWAAWDLLKTMAWWLWSNIISVAHIPLAFYRSFDDGINSPAYSLISCASGVTFWCVFLSGVQLINQLVAHTILYPIIIVGIILSTLWILWDNFVTLFSIDIR